MSTTTMDHLFKAAIASLIGKRVENREYLPGEIGTVADVYWDQNHGDFVARVQYPDGEGTAALDDLIVL